MSAETNKRQCKICKELKDRTLIGKFNDKDKKWIDPEGKLWNGNVCPPCNRNRVKDLMKKLRGPNAESN